jgi:protein involved in polysaccharide export with SLBB domain
MAPSGFEIMAQLRGQDALTTAGGTPALRTAGILDRRVGGGEADEQGYAADQVDL